MEAQQQSAKSRWRTLNWWKIGFFVLLFLFEVCREIIVVQSEARAEPNVSFHLGHYDDWTIANGVWHRTDGGGKMQETVITIECYRDEGKCVFATTNMNEQYVFAPDINRFDANFAPDSITFDDDSADCATLRFRIDLKLKKVNAIREAKKSPTNNPMCASMEERIDLTLADSRLTYGEGFEGHFLPILSLLKWAIN